MLTRLPKPNAFALVIVMTLAASAQAGTVYQIRDGDTSGPPVYQTLADFQTAILANPAMLADGDVIELYNSDYTLIQALALPSHLNLTIRGVGGKYHIRHGVEVIHSGASLADTGLTLDNVTITDDANPIGVHVENTPLTITNSLVMNSTTCGIRADGNSLVTVVNTIFTNNGQLIEPNALHLVASDSGQSLTANVIFDENAAMYSYWSSDKARNAIFVENRGVSGNSGKADLNFTIAGGKHLVIDGAIFSTNQGVSFYNYQGETVTNIVKKGSGVLKLNDEVIYNERHGYRENYPDDDPLIIGGWPTDVPVYYDNGYNYLDIQEGTVHFGDQFSWYGWNGNMPTGGVSENNGEIHVGKNGTFKPSISAGDLEERINENTFYADHSIFLLDRFTSDEGARLEVGGISSMPIIGNGFVGQTQTTIAGAYYNMGSVLYGGESFVAKSMAIDNKLMTASLNLTLSLTGDPVYLQDIASNQQLLLQLHITRVENLSILDGVGTYADVYRRMENLSEVERDMLDGIYNRGGIGSDIGFLQTIGGEIVQNSLLALRHNQANLLSKINTRLTRYQKEELALAPEITGPDYLYYSEEDPINKYSELWASIDTTWMDQKDYSTSAGYRYNTYGLSIGYDHHWDNLIAGGVLNYTTGTMKLWNQSSTKNEVDSVMAALYASWARDGWYVSGTVFAINGWNKAESAFNLPGLASATAATGNYFTRSLGVNSEFGYMMETTLVGIPIRVTPYGALTYARMWRDDVREGGGSNGEVAFDRAFRSARFNSYDASVGVRVSMPMEGNGYMLIPSVDLAVTRTIGDPSYSTTGDVYFLNNPEAVWTIPYMSDNRNSFRMAAGVDARIANGVTVGAAYEVEWRNEYWKNQLNVSASLEF